MMVYLSNPMPYDYFPNWDDGISSKEFATRLLDEYLKDYRRKCK
jgi:hypothetical protein